MKKFSIIFFLLVCVQMVQAQNDYCRWGVCKWGNDCMEGPSSIYGDHHPGCKTQWIKNNPQEWKKMQQQELAVLGALFALYNKNKAAENKKRNDEIKRLERIKFEKNKKYVQEIIRNHISYSEGLNEIYKDPIKTRNFVIKLLQTTNLNFSYANYLRFSDKSNLVAYYENKNNKPFYTGNGIEYKSSAKLPSNYQFMPQGDLPYINNIHKYNQLVNKHHSNLDILKKVFNDTILSRQNTLKKFQIFKTLGLTVDRFHETNSFAEFIKLFTLQQKKSVVDFRKPDSLINRTLEIAFFLNDFKLNFNQNNELWNYFLGETKNHSTLSVSQKNEIVVQNIISYTSTFGQDIKIIPQHMKNILRYEDMLLRQKTNSYQVSGIRDKVPKYWSYQNSLLSPKNRYVLFKDFAIIYNRLIGDREEALKTMRPVKYSENHQLKLSFNDYLQNESLYLSKLVENKNNIGLDVKKGCLIFLGRRTDSRYEFIKKGLPLYKAIEKYNEGSRYVLLNKYKLLNGSEELKKLEVLIKKIYRAFNPYKYGLATSLAEYNGLMKSMIGYSVEQNMLTTFWDYSLISKEDIHNPYVNKLEHIYRFHKTFMGIEGSERLRKQKFEVYNVNYLVFTTSVLEKKSIEERMREHRTKNPGETFEKFYDRTKFYKPNLFDIRSYLGDSKDDFLRAKGEAISYFISKTKNVYRIRLNFQSGVLLPEILADVEVSKPENQRIYVKGLNLFLKTLPLTKDNIHLKKNYRLVQIKRSKKEVRQLKKSNGKIQTVKYRLIESTNKAKASDGHVSKKSKNSKINKTWAFDPKRIKTVKVTSNDTKVIYISKDGITDLLSGIERQLEQEYGGDWYLKKSKRRPISSDVITIFLKKSTESP